jgi:hypothetical protein
MSKENSILHNKGTILVVATLYRPDWIIIVLFVHENIFSPLFNDYLFFSRRSTKRQHLYI